MKEALKLQAQQFKKKISTLKDIIKGRDEKIAQLETKITEQDELLKKDHYKEKNKILNTRIEMMRREAAAKEVILLS